jgi:hypothetical protein
VLARFEPSLIGLGVALQRIGRRDAEVVEAQVNGLLLDREGEAASVTGRGSG